MAGRIFAGAGPVGKGLSAERGHGESVVKVCKFSHEGISSDVAVKAAPGVSRGPRVK